MLLTSKDFSGQVKDGECIFQFIKTQIEESDISKSSFRTTILDGTGANKSAFRMLETEYPWMECQWCTAHVLDLSLEDVCKLGELPEMIKKAKKVVNFVKVLYIILISAPHAYLF
jgi:hypothetical protein